MRPALAAKLGYDPTQREILPVIASYLSAEKSFTSLDMCMADGEALITLCELVAKGETNYYAFGSELDPSRYKAAVKSGKFTKTLMGDFRRLRMSYDCISLQLSNPPYDYEPKENAEDPAKRTEEVALYKATNYMAIGGVLVGVWPFTLFKDRGIPVLRHLYNFYEKIKFLQYPKISENQVIVLAQRKKRTSDKEEQVFFISKEGQQWLNGINQMILNKLIPEIEMQEKPIYELPSINGNRVRMSMDYYDENVAEMEAQTIGMLEQFKQKHRRRQKFITPMPLSAAHYALLATGGYGNGVVEDENGNQHFFLGCSETKVIEVEDINEKGEKVMVRRNESFTKFRILVKEPDSSGSRILEIL